MTQHTAKGPNHTSRPAMVEPAGLEAFYGQFLDKNGVCW